MRYVIARNVGQRPTLQHIIKRGKTTCGTAMAGWTKVYSQEPIEVLLCRRCLRIHYR